ncbi:hypothetical protein VF21_03031 [Pseudogymnoascus sp. 05NY08]|nr:hypothetical protein VF21_03031 [Pseudogymnoascus sp. 05NY08]
MDPLSVTASIIAILQVTATLINYANDVKDAPKDRARFAMEASSLSSLLLNLRYQIEEENCEKSNEAWTREVTLLGVPDGPLDQYRRALEKLKLKIVSGKGLVKIGGALWWSFTKEEVAGILLRIERLKSLIQIALQMDHFKLSQAIKTGLDGIYDNSEEIKIDLAIVRSQIPAIQGSVDAVQRDQNRQKNQALVEWISSAEYSSQQSDFIARRESETGQWFLDSPEFKNWLAGHSRTLFCPGIPGAGKTMMSAIAIDHLQKVAWSDRRGVAQIFCNYKSQAEQNTTTLLSAILKQLVQANPSTAGAASRLYEIHSPNKTRPSLDDIFAALKTTMKTFATVYVVVDALDECSDHHGTAIQFANKLCNLQDEFDVRLMVTSRESPDIVNQFKSWPRLEVRASPADVKRFVSGQIDRLPRCVQRDEKLQEEVKDKIVKAVDGMFLLARLHVDSLRDKRTKAKVQSMLEMLPKGMEALNEAYDDAIKRIEAQLPDDSKLAKSALSWITYAERPLTKGELCHALAVECDDIDLDEDNILDVEDIVSVCAGLVTVDEESNIIRLVHYTTQEYFLQIRQNWNPTAQQEITTTCLTYLAFDPFRSGSCVNDADLNDRIAYYKFLDYASRYWGLHAKTVQEQVSQLAFVFLRDNKLVSCALQNMSKASFTFMNHSQSFYKFATGVHLAAKFGLQYLLAGLLSGSSGASSMPVSATDRLGRTPLSWAATEGQVEIVKLLVERDDVEVDSKDLNGRTPLSWAARWGHEATTKLLVGLDGVDADTKDKTGKTPLSWASYEGHRVVAEILLEREDVKIDAKDYDIATPFLLAVRGGAESTVKMYLERKDINFNTKDRYGMTPLIWAARLGHESIVKLLLEHEDVKANVNLADISHQTPLVWAAQQGHEAIVRLLLENEDVVAKAGMGTINGGTALSRAAQQGHEAIVRLLLENEDFVAKVDVADANGRTPLSHAVDRGHEAIVKLLVGREDVSANPKDKWGYTPLLWAARMENEAIMKLLVEREDVEVDSKNAHGMTALSLAAGSGIKSNVRLLLGRDDIDANSKDKKGYTPLLWAAMKGHEEIVKQLLERKDVKADIADGEGQTPLMRAAEGGHEAIVKLLLEWEDVDLATKNDFSLTALSLAEKKGRKDIVKLLTEREDTKADPKDNCSETKLMWGTNLENGSVLRLLLERNDIEADSKDERGYTLLMWAAMLGYDVIVKLLLERKDVDPAAKSYKGWSPLSWAAKKGNERMIRLLIEHERVEADSKNNEGRTPLMIAVQQGEHRAVRLLMGREDVDADSKDNQGYTPLMLAAESGYEEVVRLLLEQKDVEPAAKNTFDQTPLLSAARGGHEGIVKLLLERDDFEADWKDEDGMTPLMCAAYRGHCIGHEKIVELLLQRGDVDPAAKNNLGQTALSLAEEDGNERVVKLLRLKLEQSRAGRDGDDSSKKGDEIQI